MTKLAKKLVAELTADVNSASRYTLLWNGLYEANANNTPNPGPSEKNTCVAASTQT